MGNDKYINTLDEINSVSQKRWDIMLENKLRFIEFPYENPCSYPFMNQAIGESWIRSYRYGLIPNKPMKFEYLQGAELDMLLEKNHHLIDVTKNLFKSFESLVNSSGFTLYLFDKNGVLLYYSGLLFKQIKGGHFNDKIGKICHEKNIGTCSHILSMETKQPIQVIGPEQYCFDLQNMIGTSAPILDKNNDVLGAIVLNQQIASTLLTDNYSELCSHILGLLATMAEAIEVQLELENNNQYIKKINQDVRLAHNILETTFDCIDEGIVNIDTTGNIIRMNKEAQQIFHIAASPKNLVNINQFVEKSSSLLKMITKGKRNSIEEAILVDEEDPQIYLITIYPITNPDSKKLDGAILRFNNVKKVNNIVNLRTGAIATYRFDTIIGQSKELSRSIELAKRFANLPETILLIGENGTGKEMFAQAIHNYRSPHAPFIAVNCASIPRDLLEQELFGVEAAENSNGWPGKIELANGGTLFLDAIDSIPLELQPILLQSIESKKMRRVGSQTLRNVDIRVIAASSYESTHILSEGLFREDIFYRLFVLIINLPPLRERENDIELLSQKFIEKYCTKIKRRTPEIDSATRKKILSYCWPGNVRQLENAMIYAVNVCRDGIITIDCLPDAILHAKNNLGSAKEKLAVNDLSMANWEKTAIKIALMRTNYNVPQAAELLEISKATLYKKIKDYDINQ